MMMKKLPGSWSLPALVAAAALLAGCGVPPSATTPAAPAKASTAAVQKAVVQRVDTYFANEAKAPLGGSYQISTAALYKALQKNPNQFLLLDVRMPSGPATAPGYAQGHIGGAVNVPYPDLAKNLNKIKKLDQGRPIVTICYTGQWANQSEAILRLLGYNAYALHLSMSDWNQKTDILPPKHTVPNYPLVTGTKPGTFKP
ncbi:MAG: rhodanese-like domain-containing protein [Thermaerobacter sp.]|jgi:rhodanese-related sulfurtransferase|nr:rhodanese-like domain-containing protein [Thermaerobacter sp.]